ncbi:MAG: arginine deiminase family protein [Cytophagales bacterium]|nr:arginine deiminase family protein [Cytophagales bacterium]
MIRVNSEIGLLKKVIIHTPDDGIEQVTPDKAVEYLYEDIVYLDRMKKEHQVLDQLLKIFIGVENVIDFQDLLTEVCGYDHARKSLVESVAQFEKNDKLLTILLKLSPQHLAYTLITGVLKGSKKIVFSPVSNLIFCRDIGVIINNYLLITQANKRARSRESLLAWHVYHYSKLFAQIHENKWHISLSENVSELLENIENDENEYSIEGGDIMMFGKDHLLIGCSERTHKHAFEKVKEMVFKWNLAKYVAMIEIPKERYCMHLDTVMTRIDEKLCVVYAPLICEKNVIHTKRYTKGIPEPKLYSSVKDLLTDIEPDMQLIPCGGGNTPYQEREQWTDGCNLFAIKPGVAVTYDRNKMTSKAIQKAGYSVYKAEQLIKKIKNGNIEAASIEKTLILVPSNELSRARGGTHCLTFPLCRE